MAETRNVVILGAGFAGVSVAHYFMKHIYPTLKADAATTAYRLILVDQSTHFWWRLSAPRTMVAKKLLPHDKTFLPITDGFQQYGKDKDIIAFLQAQPTGVDTEGRTVTIKSVSAAADASANTPAHTETIPYHALIIATGTRTPTPLTSLHGDHTVSIKALDAMNTRLNRATSVVIGGGGPVGVETAGEIGEALNGSAGFLQSRPSHAKVKITLVTGANKLLPVLNAARASKAESMLAKVGVDVIYGKRIASTTEPPAGSDGKTTVTLDDGSTLDADVYIAGTGAEPNTAFLPPALLNAKHYVRTNGSSLRVDAAGPRVFAIGDVGDHAHGSVMEIWAATPVVGANLAHDLGVYPDGRAAGGAPDRAFKADTSETHVVPVGPQRGVGAFSGYSIPSFMVKMLKGKDYFLSNHEDITHGKKYVKP